MKFSDNIHLGTKKRFSGGAGLSDLFDLVFDPIKISMIHAIFGHPL